MTVSRQELVQRVVAQVIRAVQVQRYQVSRIAELGPGLQHAVVETVELTGAEETEPGDPGQHVDQAFGRQVSSGNVQFLNAGLFPLDLHHVLALQIWNVA